MKNLIRRSLVALMLALAPFCAYAEDININPNWYVSASSGNVGAATAAATIAAVPGQMNFICGVAFTSSGSTGAAVVSPTITGVIGGTMTFTYTTVAGVTLANAPLVVPFTSCVPATGANVAIVASMPSLGSGNTNATTVAWGYRRPFP